MASLNGIGAPPVASTGPLSPEHIRELSDARLRARKVRRAANVASISGWTLVAFAVMTLMGALFGDWMSIVLAVPLGAMGAIELSGAAMIRRFEPAGARRLGYNQIALGVLIVIYAAWTLIEFIRNPAMAALGQSTGDANVDAMVGGIATMVGWGVYGGMAVAGIVGPGLTALYYFTRERLVRDMVARTPPWVIQAMRAAA